MSKKTEPKKPAVQPIRETAKVKTTLTYAAKAEGLPPKLIKKEVKK